MEVGERGGHRAHRRCEDQHPGAVDEQADHATDRAAEDEAEAAAERNDEEV